VSGLQQRDFTLLDDKQPQTIVSFQAVDGSSKADPPQQVILLVDAVNTSYQGVVFEREQLQKFLRQNGGQLPLPMSLLLLADKSAQIQPVPSRDGNALAASLDSNSIGLRSITRSQGFYGGVERVQISLLALQKLASYEQTQPGRKLVIWLSPGWPMLSGPNVQLSAKAQQGLFNTIVSLSAALRAARVTLYSIDPLGMADAGSLRIVYYKSFLKGVSSPSKVQSGDLGLQVVAAQSGGQVLNSSNDLTSLIGSCLADAKSFYTLSFTSPPADGPNDYHSLQVKISKPGLTARTRTGYYAQP
jgi:VWFA-related protein